MADNSETNRKPDIVALAATGITIVVHLVLKSISAKPSALFIGGACLFWTLFVIVRAWNNKSAFQDWGFRHENLAQTTQWAAVLFCIGVFAMGIVAACQQNFYFPWHSLVLFLLYPIWGVIQQFLALGIVAGNVARIEWFHRRRWVLVVGIAALFGVIHCYDWRLAAATFVFELSIIPLFLRYRNLWPLGVLQGWLGVFFYMWILHEDLWLTLHS